MSGKKRKVSDLETPTVDTDAIKAILEKKQNKRKLLKWTNPKYWERWEKAPAFTPKVAHLVPMKVPLSSIYEVELSENAESVFSPSDLMDQFIALAKNQTPINMTLLIDATGSDCFYHDIKEWEDWDVKYVKLPELSADENDEDVVPDSFLDAFFACLQQHKQNAAANQEALTDVGIFSQRGFNRTGFLIVSYLVEHCNKPLDEALDMFKASCDPGIYSSSALKTLYKKYYGTIRNPDVHIVVPTPPNWDCGVTTFKDVQIDFSILTNEDKNNNKYNNANKAKQDASSSTATLSNSRSVNMLLQVPPPPSFQPSQPPQVNDVEGHLENKSRNKRRKIRTWVEESEPIPYGELIEKNCNEYLELLQVLSKLTSVKNDFPGCEAVSLSDRHVSKDAQTKKGCLNSSYFVSWRARGYRCLLLILKNGVYTISRDLTFYKVNMHFPRKRSMHENLDQTLLDGLIVQDEDNGNIVPRYLAFDIICLEGSPVWKSRLEKRLQYLQNDIVKARKQDSRFDYSKESFHFRMKDHYHLSNTEKLIKKIIPVITHRVDGLIFTPKNASYGIGGYEAEEPLFKFKNSTGCLPGIDGSISQNKVLSYITNITTN